MGFLQWLGISPRDAPRIEDSVRDSGQTFVFGKADSGETVVRHADCHGVCLCAALG